ncbi:uncharacterized protein IWZ02DRAFT_93269 [Phyllosticta citriasiana]|uniref:uncharacterized protein n=1 Tax=Phyllosticta citriasiana TaxID=595635 RepID=UPI0030FDBC47
MTTHLQEPHWDSNSHEAQRVSKEYFASQQSLFPASKQPRHCAWREIANDFCHVDPTSARPGQRWICPSWAQRAGSSPGQGRTERAFSAQTRLDMSWPSALLSAEPSGGSTGGGGDGSGVGDAKQAKRGRRFSTRRPVSSSAIPSQLFPVTAQLRFNNRKRYTLLLFSPFSFLYETLPLCATQNPKPQRELPGPCQPPSSRSIDCPTLLRIAGTLPLPTADSNSRFQLGWRHFDLLHQLCLIIPCEPWILLRRACSRRPTRANSIFMLFSVSSTLAAFTPYIFTIETVAVVRSQ